MIWSDVLSYGGAFVIGNISAGIIFNELLKHRLEGQRSRNDRQAELQLNFLLSLQGALEQVNQGRVWWGAGKVSAAEVTKKWPTQLPPADREAIAEQGDAAIRAIIPAIRDEQVRVLVKEYQQLARDAFYGQNVQETVPKVEAARKAHTTANDRIGEVIRAL